MRVLGLSLLIALGGYVVGVLLGVLFVNLSSRKANKGTEAAMTGFFYAGPAVAALSFVGALVWLMS